MTKVIPFLFILLLLPSDVSAASHRLSDVSQFEREFLSAVTTYAVIELRTNEPSDDLLAVKIVNMLGRSVDDIYTMIYFETGGNVPEILKPYYPYSGTGWTNVMLGAL